MKKLVFITALVLLAGVISCQNLPNLPKGTLLGLHSGQVILNPDVTMNQYIKFVMEKEIPAIEKNMPGLKCYVIKGLRGECADRVGFLYVFDSQAARDKYFKPDGSYNEAGLAVMKILQPILDEDAKMAKTVSEVYTDWVIL